MKETVRVRIPKGDGTEQKDYPMDQVQRVQPAFRAAEKKAERPAEKSRDEAPGEDAVTPEEEAVREFALDEGISEDEALAQIEEIAQDEEETLVDVEETDEDGGESQPLS